MTTIPFHKMSGCGNDFIIIDNRDGLMKHDQMAPFADKVCRRRMSAGADGVIFLEDSAHVDFRWHFFNSDGSRAEMCGNGARCAARFALLNGMARSEMDFETDAGVIHALVGDSSVRIRMTAPQDLIPKAELVVAQHTIDFGAVNTGVPHVVIEVPRIEDADVIFLGREIRRHPQFSPAGTNVNFVASLSDGQYAIRTYERGVEDETLACGTGNVAAAVVLAARHGLASPVTLQTRSGGYLTVHFKHKNGGFHELELEGDARVIYEGVLWSEALAYG